MKNATLISLLFVSTFGLFGNKTPAIQSNKNCHAVYLDTSRYTILKFQEEINNQPTTLSTKEIMKIEKLIESAVAKYNKNLDKRDQIKNPLKYYKQFIPFINAKGEKEVRIYCSCEIPAPDWKKELIKVIDGGTCYFQLKVDLTKNTVYEFNVNANG